MTRPVNRPNPLPPPPAPRPRPAVAQPFLPQPRPSGSAAPPPRIPAAPTPHRPLQACARPVQPAVGVKPVRPPQPPARTALPAPRPNPRPPVLQRMEEKRPPRPSGRHKALQTYRSWSGETVVLVDNGRDRISVYSTVGRGREIAYLTYGVEVGYGGKVYDFGYIQAQPSAQGKKLSSLLLYHLALKALSDGAPLLRVIKPDPGLASYWQHVGFDFAKARRQQAAHYKVDASEIRVVPQAEGSAGAVLRLNQRIAGTYWELNTQETTSHEEAWHQHQKALLVNYNMYEGSVKPRRDYSSSYIS